jgi:hypothetical protein
VKSAPLGPPSIKLQLGVQKQLAFSTLQDHFGEMLHFEGINVMETLIHKVICKGAYYIIVCYNKKL